MPKTGFCSKTPDFDKNVSKSDKAIYIKGGRGGARDFDPKPFFGTPPWTPYSAGGVGGVEGGVGGWGGWGG